jgi:predicted deacetylase
MPIYPRQTITRKKVHTVCIQTNYTEAKRVVCLWGGWIRHGQRWYAAIVKDVHYEEESGGTLRYEVEFDNEELGSVLPMDVRRNEAE